MESSYSFRRGARDIALWCLSTDIPEQNPAPAIVLQLRGAARDVAQDIDVDQVARVGHPLANGVEENLGAFPYLMALLAR
eukprot:11212818-Lingulodinium_polyedra.AAC.1